MVNPTKDSYINTKQHSWQNPCAVLDEVKSFKTFHVKMINLVALWLPEREQASRLGNHKPSYGGF